MVAAGVCLVSRRGEAQERGEDRRPAAKVDAKLTVTLLGCTPLVGETLSQDAVGVEIDHFSEPLLLLPMFTVCEGTEAPTSACTVMDVGETESCPCADACVEKITRVRRQRNRLINSDEVRIGLLYEMQTRSKAARRRETARYQPTVNSPECKRCSEVTRLPDAATHAGRTQPISRTKS